MFERYIVCEDGFRNVVKDGQIEGFELKLRIPYYRGIALSLINSIDLEIDGVSFPHEDMVFTVETGSFPYHEMSTVINNRWELGEKAVLFLKKQGGLNPGKHKVKVIINLRISYLPFPTIREGTKEIMLEEPKVLDSKGGVAVE
ncbi:C-glycoside deglycosidase beta subunit domain-containing protein [Halalkalibacter alkaliphilus]|uniref:C-deglycosylation enzyme beta subunit n=1 Tax=Halalkalibacter alkaliphilus TaxID=2917993 RepID=A0A9X2CWV4_9BACI|nr:DUF6379 domain-containing protein [Halalkalibacter alkaliphilus]MCL7749758.1 DUF6379 domain-containing protein [Halalkalibacter alkaliphilus]